jgi:hypothetical protein
VLSAAGVGRRFGGGGGCCNGRTSRRYRHGLLVFDGLLVAMQAGCVPAPATDDADLVAGGGAVFGVVCGPRARWCGAPASSTFEFRVYPSTTILLTATLLAGAAAATALFAVPSANPP